MSWTIAALGPCGTIWAVFGPSMFGYCSGARAAAMFRRPTKVFEDSIQLMHLNYLLAFDGIIASRGGIPRIEQGKIIGAIGCSGGADSQDEVVSKAGATVIGQLAPTKK